MDKQTKRDLQEQREKLQEKQDKLDDQNLTRRSWRK